MAAKSVVCRRICLVASETARELDCLNTRNAKGFGSVWGGMGCKYDFRTSEYYKKNLRDIQVNLSVKGVCLHYTSSKDLFHHQQTISIYLDQ